MDSYQANPQHWQMIFKIFSNTWQQQNYDIKTI